MRHRIVGAEAPFDIVWDSLGVAHVYAETVADAYRGMGYAAGSCLLYTSPSPRDATLSRMPSSA